MKKLMLTLILTTVTAMPSHGHTLSEGAPQIPAAKRYKAKVRELAKAVERHHTSETRSIRKLFKKRHNAQPSLRIPRLHQSEINLVLNYDSMQKTLAAIKRRNFDALTAPLPLRSLSVYDVGTLDQSDKRYLGYGPRTSFKVVEIISPNELKINLETKDLDGQTSPLGTLIIRGLATKHLILLKPLPKKFTILPYEVITVENNESFVIHPIIDEDGRFNLNADRPPEEQVPQRRRPAQSDEQQG